MRARVQVMGKRRKLVRDMADGVVGELRAAVGTHPGTIDRKTGMPIVGVRYEFNAGNSVSGHGLGGEEASQNNQGPSYASTTSACTGSWSAACAIEERV